MKQLSTKYKERVFVFLP